MATPPLTSYAVKDVTAGALLSNWTSLVDLSDMPADWWTENDTADGTKVRVFLDDGTTRLAVDPVRFDDNGQVGELRFLIPTFSAVTATTVRIYVPVAANDSVAAGDTYGSDNAYDSDWKGYWPLDEAVNNDVDGYADHTSNGNHGQGVSMALTEAAGQVGNAQDFDGSADYIDVGNDASLDLQVFTIGAWISVGDGPQRSIFASTGGNGGIQFRVQASGSDNKIELLKQEVALIGGTGSTNAFADDTQTYVVVTYNASGDFVLYINAASSGSGTNAQTFNLRTHWIGNSQNSEEFISLIDEVQIHSSVRSAAWIQEEKDQTFDNSTYWGVWVFVGMEVNFSGTAAAIFSTTATLTGTTPFSGTAAAVFSTTATLAPRFIGDIVEFTVGVKQIQSDIVGVKQIVSEVVGV